MTRELKDTVTVSSAIGMLIFGCVLTTIGFFTEPIGEVSSSVLWILGQCLIYAGSALGIANYVKSNIHDEIEIMRKSMNGKEDVIEEESEQ